MTDPPELTSSAHRALARHGLIEPTRRRRRRQDYRRWERSRAMELWQMDLVVRFHLTDGTECSVITGVDEPLPFCVCARLVLRAIRIGALQRAGRLPLWAEQAQVVLEPLTGNRYVDPPCWPTWASSRSRSRSGRTPRRRQAPPGRRASSASEPS